MNISVGELQEIMGCDKDVAARYSSRLNKYMNDYGITTRDRVAMFLAQIGHESGRLKRVVENLNYSSQALLATWPSRYNQDLANRHHRKPELIANHVYGDRMGNSKSGDGWKYRGRGLIQLTGYNNYRAYQTASGDPVTIRPDLLESPDVAVKAACWYWQENNLNKWADVGDIVSCSSVINTGKSSSSEKFINGLDDRKALYRKALSVLSWS